MFALLAAVLNNSSIQRAKEPIHETCEQVTH